MFYDICRIGFYIAFWVYTLFVFRAFRIHLWSREEKDMEVVLVRRMPLVKTIMLLVRNHKSEKFYVEAVLLGKGVEEEEET